MVRDFERRRVYDSFPIVAIYGREVVDRVRVDETNHLTKAAGPGPIRDARRVFKGARWLLLGNRCALTTSADRVRRWDLLQAHRVLYTGFVPKKEMKRLWDFRSPAAALRFWNAWRQWALSSRVPALK